MIAAAVARDVFRQARATGLTATLLAVTAATALVCATAEYANGELTILFGHCRVIDGVPPDVAVRVSSVPPGRDRRGYNRRRDRVGLDRRFPAKFSRPGRGERATRQAGHAHDAFPRSFFRRHSLRRCASRHIHRRDVRGSWDANGHLGFGILAVRTASAHPVHGLLRVYGSAGRDDTQHGRLPGRIGVVLAGLLGHELRPARARRFGADRGDGAFGPHGRTSVIGCCRNRPISG